MSKALILAAAVAAIVLVTPTSAAVNGTVRVSVDANGTQLSAPSGAIGSTPSLIGSGGAVAFESLGPASATDANGTSDIFFRDVDQNLTTVISVNDDGKPGNNRSYAPAVSGSGRWVAFESLASDLVDDDGNRYPDVFVRDQEESRTTRVSVSSDEAEGDGPSVRPAISTDGNMVAFCSSATNLVPGDYNAVSDVFIRDRGAEATQRLVPPGAAGSPVEGCERVAVNGTGSQIAFAYRVDNGSGNATSQVYLHDVLSGETRLISGSGDTPGNGPSGRFGLAMSDRSEIVAFDSLASDLVSGDSNGKIDVFGWSPDEELARLSVAEDGSEANGDSGQLGLNVNVDGRFVVYSSNASNIVVGDGNLAADIFRLDRKANDTTIASVDAGDQAGNAPSYSPDVADNGETVSFVSLATSLIYGDRNRHPDVFLRGTEFPNSGGLEGEPIATPLPDDTVDLPKPIEEDDGGIPTAVLIAGIAGVVLILFVASWFLLGRGTRA